MKHSEQFIAIFAHVLHHVCTVASEARSRPIQKSGPANVGYLPLQRANVKGANKGEHEWHAPSS